MLSTFEGRGDFADFGWNPCACGELKPKKGESCWRCIERDREFARLDALIAAGYGSIQQWLIPKEIMARCSLPASQPHADFQAL